MVNPGASDEEPADAITLQTTSDGEYANWKLLNFLSQMKISKNLLFSNFQSFDSKFFSQGEELLGTLHSCIHYKISWDVILWHFLCDFLAISDCKNSVNKISLYISHYFYALKNKPYPGINSHSLIFVGTQIAVTAVPSPQKKRQSYIIYYKVG